MMDEIYILLFWNLTIPSGGPTPSIQHVEFDSKVACEKGYLSMMSAIDSSNKEKWSVTFEMDHRFAHVCLAKSTGTPDAK